MCYNLILSSVNYVFDWCYSPGRNLGGGFCGSETPNEEEKKIFSAYGATTSPDALSKKTPTPVAMQFVKRAEETQNKSTSTENHDPIVPTSQNDGAEGFVVVPNFHNPFSPNSSFEEITVLGDFEI